MSTFSTDNLFLRHTDMLYLHIFAGRVQRWAYKYLMWVADLKIFICGWMVINIISE